MIRRALAALLSASALVAAVGARSQTPADPQTADATVASLRAYLAKYATDLIAVVSRERYENQRPQRGTASQPPLVLEAEFAIVAVAGTEMWQGYRDVISVNGRPLEDRERRLQGLFQNPPEDVLTLIRRINFESTRYYNSPVARAFYNPATCLEILSAAHASRVTLTKTGDESLNGQRMSVLRFSAAGILKNAYGGTPAGRGLKDPSVTGRVLIHPATGAIWQCDLTIDTPTPFAGSVHRTNLHTRFSLDSRLDLLVPAEHTEQTTNGTAGQAWNAKSTYTDYRKFAAFGRIKTPDY